MICPHCGNDTEQFEPRRVSIETDKEGRWQTWTEIARDHDGKQVRKRVDTYTYKKTGEVDVITQQVFDADDKLIEAKEIRHAGGAPVVKVLMAVSRRGAEDAEKR